MHQSVAGLDRVALLDIKLHHASRQLARDAHRGALDLALDELVGTVEKYKTYHGDDGDGHHHQPHSPEQRALGPGLIGLLGFYSVIFVCHIGMILSV